MKTPSDKTFWQVFLFASILLAAIAFQQTVERMGELGISLWRSRWIFLLAAFTLNLLAGSFALRNLTPLARMLPARQSQPAGWLLLTAGILLAPFFRFLVFRNILPQYAPILWVFWWGTLLQALGLHLLFKRGLGESFLFALAAQGILYQVYASLTAVSAYPFSIGYSEASRHYYASMFHAARLYGVDLPLPFLHPSRYLLLSLPFAFSNLPLWAHRLWQALLWIFLTGASAALLAKRIYARGWLFFFVSAWAYLYFLQGAVYYHLQVMVILILAGVQTDKFWRGLFWVALASFWAGVSRVNWFPVPAMLAIALYLLEVPLAKKNWRYWLLPFFWGVAGLASALMAQAAYIQISGNADAANFASSFSSDLIWARLIPNEIFSGVLPGITLVSLPLLAALVWALRGISARVHPLRWLALAGMAVILFTGGLVVSVKIGGGADLHNMDAFMVLLALISALVFGGQLQTEAGEKWTAGKLPAGVVFAALLIPISYVMPRVGTFFAYNAALSAADVKTLQARVQNTAGEFLFLTERQLFAFGDLPAARMIPEYEQIELMEFAMSGNRAELENFYADLNAARFEAIVAEEQKFVLRKEGAFKEENNVWVRYVGAPLLCAYKPTQSLHSANIQIFVPRPNPKCKNPFEP